MDNSVKLIGWYGGDEAISCSAWTSTSRDLSPEKRERIPVLIKQLWNAEPVPHGTPFEKGMVHFLVNCDIASHIHLLKHRISSINAESARYKELKEDKYYIPEDWTQILIKDDVNGNTWARMLETMSTLSNKWYHQCLEELTPILGRKRITAIPLPALSTSGCQKRVSSLEPASAGCDVASIAFVSLARSERPRLRFAKLFIYFPFV